MTVNPQKVTWDTPAGKLGRFTQQWDKDTNFKLAVSFHGRNDVASSKFVKTDAVDEQGNKLFDLKPEPNSTVTERRPVIEAGLARLGGVVPESMTLRIGGFGAVPAEFDPATQTVRYQMPQKTPSGGMHRDARLPPRRQRQGRGRELEIQDRPEGELSPAGTATACAGTRAGAAAPEKPDTAAPRN